MKDKKALEDWLEKQQNYFEKEYQTKKKFPDELKRDIFKQTLSYLQREGWDKTKEYCNKRVGESEGKLNGLSSILRGCYQDILNKMWSINKS